MLTLILNWIYILVTTFCLGYGFSLFCGKFLHYSLKRMDSILMAGIVMATAYAQISSLFYRVNIEANIVLMVFCLGVLLLCRKQIGKLWKDAFLGSSILYKVLVVVLFFLWAYYTSRGYRVPDMNIYHGQSIRWIEEYGVVKGLGNLHERFGYNSSIFAVSALYSMKFLLGRSLHGVNGWIAFVMSLEVLNLGKAIKRRKLYLSDYARVGLLYYMSMVCEEIVAPSSDYPAMFTIFFIVIKWLETLEEQKTEEKPRIAPFALLCVVGVQAITFKVSAGLILILLIKPAYELLKGKHWKEIGIYLGLGLLVAVPWLARNVIITGWLLYPFPALDLFRFDWKMTNVENIEVDAALIKAYARGHNDKGLYLPLAQWFPNWFQTQLYSLQKVFVLADMVSVLCVAGIGIFIFLRKKWEKLDVLLVLFTLAANYLFWQFSAPMMRYGYAHVLLLALLTFGYFVESLKLVWVVRAVYIGIALFACFRVYKAVDYVRRSYQVDAYIWQETYSTYELEARQIGDVTLYYSPYCGPVGYDLFPATPIIDDSLELRGDSLKDGFRRAY